MGRIALSCLVIFVTNLCFANSCFNQLFSPEAISLHTNNPSSNITEIEKKYLIQDHQQLYITPIFKSNFGNWNHLIKSIKAKGDVVTQGFFDASLHDSISAKFQFSKLDFKPTEVRIIKVIRTQKNNKVDYIYSAKGPGTYARRETEFYITESQYQHLWNLTVGRRVHRLRLNIDIQTAFGEKEVSLDYYLDRKLFIAEVEFKTETDGKIFHDLGLDVTEIVKYKNAHLAN